MQPLRPPTSTATGHCSRVPAGLPLRQNRADRSRPLRLQLSRSSSRTLMLAFVTASYKRISNLFRPAILGTCRYFVNDAELFREDEFDGRVEADIAVDDLAALVNDEERGN